MIGWGEAPLGELCELGPQYGANSKAVPASGKRPRYIRITDIASDGRLRSNPIVEADTNETDSYELIEGDVLFARSGATVGKTYLHEAANGYSIFAGYLIRFRPNASLLDPRFLFYFTRSHCYARWLESKRRVAAQPNVNGAEYASLRVPLPLPSEQRRIVETLDQADHLHRLRAEADTKAERILPALLARTLGNPATWASNPRSRPLGDLVDPLSGATPSKNVQRFWGGEVPWVSPKDMKRDFIFDSQNHVSQAALDETNLSLVEPGSVLIVVRGMILARDIPVAINMCPVTINQDMKALVPKTTEVSAPFVWAALFLAKPALQSLVGTAGHGTRKIDTLELMQFPLIVADPDHLNRIDLVVEQHRMLIEQRRRSKSMIDQLFAVMLGRAFDGSLTASWREAHMNELLQETELQAKAIEEASRTC